MNAVTETKPEVAHVDGAIRNPANPHHFMVIRPEKRRVRVYRGNQLLADTHDARQLIEVGRTIYDPAYYIPADDLSPGLQGVDKTTYCPLKGDATYKVLDGEEIGWSYPAPFDWAQEIAGRTAFWTSKVAIVFGD